MRNHNPLVPGSSPGGPTLQTLSHPALASIPDPPAGRPMGKCYLKRNRRLTFVSRYRANAKIKRHSASGQVFRTWQVISLVTKKKRLRFGWTVDRRSKNRPDETSSFRTAAVKELLGDRRVLAGCVFGQAIVHQVEPPLVHVAGSGPGTGGITSHVFFDIAAGQPNRV